MKDNKIVRLSFILFLICAIVAGVLGVVNMVTAPVIQERADAKTREAYAVVFTTTGGFEEVTDQLDKETYSTIDKIDQATDGAGWVVTTTFSGAQGSITMLVGVSSDYKCTGISILEHSETSGLGANAASTAEVGVNFRAQFIGKDDTVTLADIDQLSGATITSRSVTNAVATSIKACESLG